MQGPSTAPSHRCVASLAVYTLALTLHPSAVAGAILLIVGLAGYAVGIGTAVFRVRQQYSRAMREARSIRVGTALAAAGRLWPFLLLAVIGAAILILNP